MSDRKVFAIDGNSVTPAVVLESLGRDLQNMEQLFVVSKNAGGGWTLYMSSASVHDMSFASHVFQEALFKEMGRV